MPAIATNIVKGREAFALGARQIVAMPRLQLRILSQELEPAVYAVPEFVEVLKAQLLANRRLRVRVLVADGRLAARNAALRELARRLSSQFEFRTPLDTELPSFADEALMADRQAYLHRSDARAPQARLATGDAPGAHLLISRFDELWVNAEPAADFRDMPM